MIALPVELPLALQRAGLDDAGTLQSYPRRTVDELVVDFETRTNTSFPVSASVRPVGLFEARKVDKGITVHVTRTVASVHVLAEDSSEPPRPPFLLKPLLQGLFVKPIRPCLVDVSSATAKKLDRSDSPKRFEPADLQPGSGTELLDHFRTHSSKFRRVFLRLQRFRT